MPPVSADSGAQQPPPPRAVLAAAPAVQRLLKAYRDVLNPSKMIPPTKHDVRHHIETDGRPVSSRFRRLDAEKLAAAKAEFAQLEKEGVIERSNSCWSSPLHMVRKADGSWRCCGDYRRLNMITKPDRYPLPNMLDFSGRLAGCVVFSKLDLRKGYYQIPVAPADVCKTAIITPFGLFHFKKTPFGLRNAGMTFQRMMDQVFAGLDFVFWYLDDIVIASQSEEQHLVHLQIVLERLREHGLVLNAEKCEFGRSSIEFLGHLVSAKGAVPLKRHVAAITRFPLPGSVKELQAFLGLVNFYRRFLPGVAKTLLPLTNYLKGGKTGAAAVSWDESMVAAFKAAKAAICAATELAHPQSSAQLSLWVDASASHIGGALQQLLPGRSDWQPLGFFSRKLSEAEKKYSAFDRELLACKDGIRHFRHMLEATAFTIYTDHRPLTHALGRVSEPWSARQARHLAEVAEYTSDIRHVAGKDNVVADTLSRPPVAAPVLQPATAESVKAPSGSLVSSARTGEAAGACLQEVVAAVAPATAPEVGLCGAAELAAAQGTCRETKELAASISLKVSRLRLEGVEVLCDESMGRPRPLVPVSLRKQLFEAIHNLAHPGTRASRRLIAAKYVWRGLNKDVAAWCRACQHCARGKVTRQPQAPVQPIQIPQQRFSHIHLDIVGPLPASSSGHTHLLTIIDRSTRWLEAVPLSSTSAEACADAVCSAWIARFGVPAAMTSDRGRQFTSAVWTSLCSTLGVEHCTTTSYHPQSNGMVERAHRQLKDALRSRLAGSRWLEHLPWVLLGLRAAPKEDSALSSAEMVFGTQLRLPGELASGQLVVDEAFLRRLKEAEPLPTRQPSYAEAAARPAPTPALMGAKMVFVKVGGHKPPLDPQYAGPYLVVSRGLKVFTVDIGGRAEVVSVDRLKPFLGADQVTPAAAPRRGRPPGAGVASEPQKGPRG